MTPFAIGQEVTFPHSNHTTGGVITAVDVEDGVTWCTVRMLAGAEIRYREDALYAKAPQRDAARAVEAERADAQRAIENARLAVFPPAPPPR